MQVIFYFFILETGSPSNLIISDMQSNSVSAVWTISFVTLHQLQGGIWEGPQNFLLPAIYEH